MAEVSAESGELGRLRSGRVLAIVAWGKKRRKIFPDVVTDLSAIIEIFQGVLLINSAHCLKTSLRHRRRAQRETKGQHNKHLETGPSI